jgi:hypothetical protein
MAQSLNATVIPQVKGKWPGNLDVALRVVRSFEDGYVLQIFMDLFREHNATTLNTRLLWDDQVLNMWSLTWLVLMHVQMITMDECVMKFVSSTGFSHFEKGILWHERIDKLLGTGLFNAWVIVNNLGNAFVDHIFREGVLWKTVCTLFEYSSRCSWLISGSFHCPTVLCKRTHF